MYSAQAGTRRSTAQESEPARRGDVGSRGESAAGHLPSRSNSLMLSGASISVRPADALSASGWSEVPTLRRGPGKSERRARTQRIECSRHHVVNYRALGTGRVELVQTVPERYHNRAALPERAVGEPGLLERRFRSAGFFEVSGWRLVEIQFGFSRYTRCRLLSRSASGCSGCWWPSKSSVFSAKGSFGARSSESWTPSMCSASRWIASALDLVDVVVPRARRAAVRLVKDVGVG